MAAFADSNCALQGCKLYNNCCRLAVHHGQSLWTAQQGGIEIQGCEETYSRELKQTPGQQCNAEGGGVGHLQVAGRAPLKVSPCDVTVQGAHFISHGI